jgi:hypothetical protein
MTDRTPKRSREQAREIARILRRRHVPPEAEAAAKREMAKLSANKQTLPKAAALLAGDSEPDTLMEAIRLRENIKLVNSGDQSEVFTDAERNQARTILDELMMRYARKH